MLEAHSALGSLTGEKASPALCIANSPQGFALAPNLMAPEKIEAEYPESAILSILRCHQAA